MWILQQSNATSKLSHEDTRHSTSSMVLLRLTKTKYFTRWYTHWMPDTSFVCRARPLQYLKVCTCSANTPFLHSPFECLFANSHESREAAAKNNTNIKFEEGNTILSVQTSSRVWTFVSVSCSIWGAWRISWKNSTSACTHPFFILSCWSCLSSQSHVGGIFTSSSDPMFHFAQPRPKEVKMSQFTSKGSYLFWLSPRRNIFGCGRVHVRESRWSILGQHPFHMRHRIVVKGANDGTEFVKNAELWPQARRGRNRRLAWPEPPSSRSSCSPSAPYLVRPCLWGRCLRTRQRPYYFSDIVVWS